MWAIIIFFVGHWYLSLFTQTFFHHRYSAHKMFTMSPFMEKVFFVLSGIFQGSSYLSPYAYGALHRLHHAYADTEKDPHSPSFDSNVFTMMKRTKNEYYGIWSGETKLEERFLKDLPKWTWFDKLADNWAVRIGWGVVYTLFYIIFVPEGMWYLYLLLPIHYLMGPFHGAIINWFAHKYGYKNFKVDNTSKNLLPVDILMLGESYHNNHHKHSGRANFGWRWFEIDPVYYSIKIMHWMRIIRLRVV